MVYQANSPAVEEIFEANKHMLRWMKTPQMDEFAAKCAADIIRAHRLDLMRCSTCPTLTTSATAWGVHGDLEHAFRFIDGQMGLVLDALEETGGVENTNIVLLGDHVSALLRRDVPSERPVPPAGLAPDRGGRFPGRLSGLCRQLFAQRTHLSPAGGGSENGVLRPAGATEEVPQTERILPKRRPRRCT